MIATDLLSAFNWNNIIVFVPVCLITYYLIIFQRTLNYWKNRGVNQGPLSIPPFGILLTALIRPIQKIDLEYSKKYGRVYGYFEGTLPALVITDPELIKQVMVKDFDVFRNRRDVPLFHEILKAMLFFERDDDWKITRPIVTPTFTSGKIKKMVPLLNSCVTSALEHLDGVANNEKKIEMKAFWGCYTLDVIAKCCFATEINTHKEKNNIFIKNVDKFFQKNAFEIVAVFVLPRFVAKKLGLEIFPAGPVPFFRQAVECIIQQRKSDKNKTNDFVQLLIDAQLDESVDGDNVDEPKVNHDSNKVEFGTTQKKKLTEMEIIAQCVLFFIAGYETTATLLSYVSYMLALNPIAQGKLFQELNEAEKDDEGLIPYDTLMKLPYLEAIINETFRVFPPVLRIERIANRDYELGDTGILIEKGAVVYAPINALHHDPEHFPDPEVYNPERFLPGAKPPIKPYTFMPFGTGPRNCVAMRFALLESKLAIAKVVMKFQFVRVEETVFPPVFQLGQVLNRAESLTVGMEKR